MGAIVPMFPNGPARNTQLVTSAPGYHLSAVNFRLSNWVDEGHTT
jgi:hypothetical protein